jgi:hypothetical protein
VGRERRSTHPTASRHPSEEGNLFTSYNLKSCLDRNYVGKPDERASQNPKCKYHLQILEKLVTMGKASATCIRYFYYTEMPDLLSS